MTKLSLFALTIALAACVEDPDLALETEPDTSATFLTPWTEPQLKWILHAAPGTARLARRNAATNTVSVLATHTFDSHWRAVSVAGNKLLWQRTDTGQLSLWTIDPNGAYVSHVYLAPPSAGWRAVSIALADDGACPAPLLAYRSYVITLEGPTQVVNNVVHEPAPLLWTVNDAGTVTATESLPQASNLFRHLRDFRPSRDGRWALLDAPNGSGSFGVHYYQKLSGVWHRLRTDSYTAAAGLVSCTLHPSGVGLTNCATDFNDLAPGANFEPWSFQLAQDSSSSQFANTLLWSRADGVASVFALDPLGQETSAATALTPPAATYRAVSLGGFDESPTFGLICDHRPPPIPRY